MNTTTQGTRVKKGKDIVLSLVFGGIVTLLFVSGLVYMMNQSGQSNTNYTKAYASGPSNTAPVATNATFSLNSGTTATYGLAANVSDVDSNIDFASYDLDPSTAGQQTSLIVSGKGTFSITTNGTSQLTFVRDVGFTSGSAAISYTVADTLATLSNTATATVNVAISDVTAPTIVAQTGSTIGVTPVTINALSGAQDEVGGSGISATSVQVTIPVGATFVVNANGTVTITPTCAAPCSATANYTIADIAGNRSSASTITINVTAPTSTDTTAPVAVSDTGTTPQNTNLTTIVSTNDSDNVGGSGLKLDSIVILTTPAPVGGSFSPNLTGGIVFVPTPNFVGAASASYKISDIAGNQSNAATLTITVTAVSDSDGDSISNVTEDAGPNNGDANGDGIKDSLQPLVATIPTLSSSKYVSVQISNGVGPNCSKITQTQIQNLTGLVVNTDGSFSYPYGLLQIDLPCTQADVTIDWYIGDTKDIKYRKLVYTTPGVTSTATYNDYTTSVTKFTRYGINGYRAQFTLKDGQVGDLTAADGRILDPSGIADTTTVAAPALPRTGLVGFGIFSSVLLLFVAGIALYNAASHSGSFKRINY